MLCRYSSDLKFSVTVWHFISTTLILMVRRCVASRWLLGFARLTTITAMGSVAKEPFNIEGVLFEVLLVYQTHSNDVFRFVGGYKPSALVVS